MESVIPSIAGLKAYRLTRRPVVTQVNMNYRCGFSFLSSLAHALSAALPMMGNKGEVESLPYTVDFSIIC